MSSMTYRVGIDINHDGFFARELDTDTAINTLYYGSTYKDVQVALITGGSITKFSKQRWFIYGGVYYRMVTSASPASGFRVGDPTRLDCLPNTEYTVSFWHRGIDNYSGDDVSWLVNMGGTVSSTIVSAFDLNWTQTSVTVISGASNQVFINIQHTASAVVTFDIAGIMIVPGDTAPDAFTAGAPSDIHEDITQYMRSASWTNGMKSAYEQVAGDSLLSLVLDNSDGHWNLDYIGSEELTNGDFDDWTAGVPDGWTKTNILNTVTMTEVGTGGGYGDTGTDAVNFTSLSFINTGIAFFEQTGALTVGERYKLSYTISYVSKPSSYMVFYNGANPISSKVMSVGTYEFYFTAVSADVGLYILITPSSAVLGDSNFTLDDISIKEVSRYAGIQKGSMVWLMDISISPLPFYAGRLESIRPTIGLYDNKTVTIEASDPMPALMAAEYIPYFDMSKRIDQVLTDVLTRTDFAYPYLSDYWILGAQGASWLGEETFLFDSTELTLFEPADTTLDYVGDIASNEANGISAQAYIRDLLTAEFFGRFYFDTRMDYFRFINRNYDATIVSPALTLSDDDFETYDYRYADDLVNAVKVYYNQRSFDNTIAVLWRSEVDIIVQPGQTRTITGRYRDPNNPATQIAAFETYGLSPGADYTITPADIMPLVAIAVQADAQSAQFQITNSADTGAATISGLQIRGLQIKKFDRQLVEAIDGDSLFRHDKREQSYNIPLISSFDDVQNYALSLVNLFSQPLTRFESISFVANKTHTRLLRAANNYLNQMIHINTTNGHNADYHIVGERHDITAGGEDTHVTTWILKPDDRIDYWCLGEAGRSELGQTTTLAF